MSTLLIVLLVLFVVGLVLAALPDGRFFRYGVLLGLVILGILVFWPALR